MRKDIFSQVGQIPDVVATFAISLMMNNAKNNSQMQHDRGQNKFSRHLRILHGKRAAGRAMNRPLQNCRGFRSAVQKFRRRPEHISPNFHPIRYARRTQKQKASEQLVVVSPRLKPVVFEKHFQSLPVVQVLKNRYVDPRMPLEGRTHNQLLFNCSAPKD